MNFEIKQLLLPPLKFATRFFILWNTFLLATFLIAGVLFLFLGPLVDKQFPALGESKLGIGLMLFGIPVLTTSLAFAVTYFLFKRAYPRLAAAVSPDLPASVSSREMLKSWAIAYWGGPIAIFTFMAFGIFTGGQLNHRGLGITIYPLAIFIVSLPVYLRLQYLAGKELLVKS